MSNTSPDLAARPCPGCGLLPAPTGWDALAGTTITPAHKRGCPKDPAQRVQSQEPPATRETKGSTGASPAEH